MITKNLPKGKRIQAIMLSKSVFPNVEDASTWVRQLEGDASDIETTETDWVFHQFPVSKAHGKIHIHETEHPGVVAAVCKQLVEKDMTSNDMAGGERHDLATDHDTLPTVPSGAEFLTKMKAFADEGVNELSRHQHLHENPELKKYAADHIEQLKKAQGYVAKSMKELYPEQQFGGVEKPGAAENINSDEEPEENDNDYVKHYKFHRKSIKKSMDAMEMNRDQELAKAFKAGSGVHHLKMPHTARAIIKAMDHLHNVHQTVQDDMPMQDHPEIKSLAANLNEALPAKKGELKSMLTKHYPEVHKALGWEDEAPPEETPAAEGEGDEEEIAPEEGQEEGGEPGADEDVNQGDEEETPEASGEGEEEETEEPEEEPEEGEAVEKDMPEGDESEVQEERNETDSEKESEEDIKPKNGEMKHYSVQVYKSDKWVPFKKGITLPVARKAAAQLLSQGIAYHIVDKAGKSVKLKDAPPWFFKKEQKKKSVKKSVTKLGANQVEPPPEDEPIPEVHNGVAEGEPLEILQAIIDYLEDMKLSMGGEPSQEQVLASSGPDGDENPYEFHQPHNMAPGKGKKVDEEDVIEKEEAAPEEEEEIPEGISKEDIAKIAKQVNELRKNSIDFSQRLGWMTGKN